MGVVKTIAIKTLVGFVPYEKNWDGIVEGPANAGILALSYFSGYLALEWADNFGLIYGSVNVVDIAIYLLIGIVVAFALRFLFVKAFIRR